MKKIYILFSLLVTGTFLISCEESFLEEKPDKALVVPRTLEDLKALIYNDINIMNQDPAIGEIASDDIYTTPEGLEGASVFESNVYRWADDVYEGGNVPDWNQLYEQVFYANVVLGALEDIPVDAANRQEWEKIKGSALFFRANAFYNLASIFTFPYDAGDAPATLGIPIMLEADVEARAVRTNLQETYDRILEDLTTAVKLLPPLAAFKTQPSRATVFALASRVFLTMHDYQKAGAYADSCLQLHNVLLDYNAVDGTKRAPFPLMNGEVLFQSTTLTYSFLLSGLTFIDPDLYASYDENDLRRTLFFTDKGNGLANFRGSYNGNIILFSGIATDELYLTRAECRARLGDLPGAMDDLNTLLETRWKEGTFEPFTANSKEEAIALILKERRKELVFRGHRWSDLRRLNQYPERAKTLTRGIGGESYTLPPGDIKYAFPIPDAEIEGSGIAQNPR
jgi:starch-binding outer membrane protein, SusD/RagB family